MKFYNIYSLYIINFIFNFSSYNSYFMRSMISFFWSWFHMYIFFFFWEHSAFSSHYFGILLTKWGVGNLSQFNCVLVQWHTEIFFFIHIIFFYFFYFNRLRFFFLYVLLYTYLPTTASIHPSTTSTYKIQQ